MSGPPAEAGVAVDHIDVMVEGDRRSQDHKRCKRFLCAVPVVAVISFIIVVFCGITVLNEEQQLYYVLSTGRYAVNGPVTSFVWPGSDYQVRTFQHLNEDEYVIVVDEKQGTKRIQRGPGRFFLGAYEVLGSAKAKGITLTQNEYMHVTDLLTGAVKQVNGPRMWFPLHAFEEPNPKAMQITLAEYESLITKDADGTFTLHSGYPGGASFPLGFRSSVVEFEWTLGGDVEKNRTTVPVTKIDGRIQQLPFWFDDVRTSDNIEFELEGVVFWQVVDARRLINSTADPPSDIWHHLRARIARAAAPYTMMEFLRNASLIREEVLMAENTEFASFYSTRGLRLQGLELIEVELHDDILAKQIAETIANASTSRMNSVRQAAAEHELQLARLARNLEIDIQRIDNALLLEQKNHDKALLEYAIKVNSTKRDEVLRAENAFVAQENNASFQTREENFSHHLKVAALQSQIELEQLRSRLLDLSGANRLKESSTSGAAIGVRLGRSIDEYLQTLNESSMLNLSERMDLYKLHQDIISRNMTTANLASGQAHIYVTPEDVHLRSRNPWRESAQIAPQPAMINVCNGSHRNNSDL